MEAKEAVAGEVGAPIWDFSRFVAIDIETTGLDPTVSEIIELGAVRFVDGKETEIFHALIRPEKGYPERNRRLTGIDPEVLERGCDAHSGLKDFLEFIGNDILVSHNSTFDIGFLTHHIDRLGLEIPANDSVCTLHLAALVDPEADTLQLGALAKLWGVQVVEAHRALLDARMAGNLVLKMYKELSNWSPDFIAHLASYRGKSLDTIFNVLDGLIDPGEVSIEWRLDEAIREHLVRHGHGSSLQPFPEYPVAPVPEGNPDPDLEKKILEGFKRGGVTLIEDIRPGSSAASCAILPGVEGVPRFVVAVPDENSRRRVMGRDSDMDSPGSGNGTFYLGRRDEYLCLRKAFGEDGRPEGWLELSPYERIVLVRWIAGTRTGRLGRVNWWLLNNFSGLKGHLNASAAGSLGCISPDSHPTEPCFTEMAKSTAEKAARVVVDHKHLFAPADESPGSVRLLGEMPSLLIEGADQLIDGARASASKVLDLEPFARKIASFLEGVELLSESAREALQSASEAVKEILDVSRRAIRECRDTGVITFNGPLHIDSETWNQEVFSILAGTLEPCGERLMNAAKILNEAADIPDEYRSLGKALDDAAGTIRMFRRTHPGWAASLEGAPLRSPRRVTLRLTPVEIKVAVQGLTEEVKGGFVATGRHLRHGGSFERLRSLWGLEPDTSVEEVVLEDASLVPPELFVPEDLTPPTGRSGRKYHWQRYMERTANLLRMLAETLGGRTVAAFSAHHELRKVREILDGSPPQGVVVLAQFHDGTKSAIIREYLNNPATLLMGGRNLLEGVDLRPMGFTALVVVKLPFSSPEQPLHRAALQMAESDGLDGMKSYLVPLAVEITNRWIDSLIAGPIPPDARADRPAGAVILLDPRAVYNDWGEDFLGALDAGPLNRLPFREMLMKLRESSRADEQA